VEYGDHGNMSERWATKDLQDAGFLVFQVDHRLAPPNTLPGQATDGRAPFQTDDLKRHILGALADHQCNGSIYLIGGSAGGTLVLWCALDPAPGNVPQWDEPARAHIKAVVSLSGPTNFCDWNNLGGIPSDALAKFENALDNYVGLPDQTKCDDDPTGKLNHASPAWLVTNGATSSPPPIRLYATNGDSVPYAQEDDMFQALFTRYGVTLDYRKYRMSYQYTDPNHHAFTYWHSINDDPSGGNECVGQQVIEFLQANP
jgi:acetyl esterase/lipase